MKEQDIKSAIDNITSQAKSITEGLSNFTNLGTEFFESLKGKIDPKELKNIQKLAKEKLNEAKQKNEELIQTIKDLK